MAEEIDIRINLDNLVIGDLELIWSLELGDKKVSKEDVPKMMDLLERVVEGGCRHLPLRYIRVIFARIQAEMGEAADPGN